MTRRIWSAALALSMAGGVYLAAVPAQASNMGFKLERDLDYKRNAQGAPLSNIYWLAFPYFNGLGDVANTAAPEANKCVGEAGGPAASDGVINVDDMICALWTARINTPNGPAGTFSVSWFKRSDCIPDSRLATFRFGVANFSGTVFPAAGSGDLLTDVGYQINLANQAPDAQQNRAILVGSHDPGFPGHAVAASLGCAATAPQRDIIAVPYHTMYQKAAEILCGLEGSDWDDDGLDASNNPANGPAGDGLPDSLDECDTSVFDGRNTIAVSMFFNDEATNGVKTCAVAYRSIPAPGIISWTGCPSVGNFDLVPGEGYLLNILPAHNGTTTFLSPHF